MAQKFSIPSRAWPALALIAQHSDQLVRLRPLASEIAGGSAANGSLAARFAAASNLPPKKAEDIVTQILAFHALREQMELSASEMVEQLSETVATAAPEDWRVANLEQWVRAREAIEEALSSSHPIAVVAKSARLSYRYSNILHRAALLTDVRPLFDDTGTTIHRLTVTNSLELEYFDGTDRRFLYATLDLRDIVKLRRACERAEAKVAALQALMGHLTVPLKVEGGTDDE